MGGVRAVTETGQGRTRPSRAPWCWECFVEGALSTEAVANGPVAASREDGVPGPPQGAGATDFTHGTSPRGPSLAFITARTMLCGEQFSPGPTPQPCRLPHFTDDGLEAPS